MALRNFTEPNDIHDVIKTLAMKIIRRKRPDSGKIPIYSEYDPKKPNEDYPDIWTKTNRGDIIVYEIQRKVSESWKERMNEKYNSISDWHLIDIKKIEKEWVKKLKKSPKDPIGKLTKILEKEII